MNNQEARKAAIKAAYGEYWSKVKHLVDGDGFLPMETWHNIIGYNGIYGIDIDSKNNIRPGDLIGIETNNGWIRLEGLESLPEEEGNYLFLTESKQEARNHYNPRIQGRDFEYKQLFLEIYTHYKPNEKNTLPVY